MENKKKSDRGAKPNRRHESVVAIPLSLPFPLPLSTTRSNLTACKLVRDNALDKLRWALQEKYVSAACSIQVMYSCVSYSNSLL